MARSPKAVFADFQRLDPAGQKEFDRLYQADRVSTAMPALLEAYRRGPKSREDRPRLRNEALDQLIPQRNLPLDTLQDWRDLLGLLAIGLTWHLAYVCDPPDEVKSDPFNERNDAWKKKSLLDPVWVRRSYRRWKQKQSNPIDPAA